MRNTVDGSMCLNDELLSSSIVGQLYN